MKLAKYFYSTLTFIKKENTVLLFAISLSQDSHCLFYAPEYTQSLDSSTTRQYNCCILFVYSYFFQYFNKCVLLHH